MTNLDDEAETLAQDIHAFVAKKYQDRYLGFLPLGDRTRARFSDMLNHRLALELAPGVATPVVGPAAAVHARLVGLGAPPGCQVVSDGSVNGQTMPLAEALQKVVGLGLGSLVTCLPGKLAYYEDETSRSQLVLRPRK